MEGYIDIHSHILPQLDDGSRNMEQTMNMLKIAYTEGIRTIIATPHYHEGRSMVSQADLKERLIRVNEAAKLADVEIEILPGCEVYYSHESVRLLKERWIPTLAGSRYVLVEFSPAAELRYMKNALQEFFYEGYLPVIAHVERYGNVAKKMENLQELISMGAYIQVNAMSILGEADRSSQKIAKKILKSKLAHFVATDSHSDRTRSPRLIKCTEYITKKFGVEYTKELLIHNPGRVIRNEYLDEMVS